MSEDEKNFLTDMLKSQGWAIYEAKNKEMVEQYRFLATQQNVKLEDRLWYSALALGREESINNIKNLV